jgi:L-lactate utilization protein LutB
MENREKLFKQYKSDCPQTIGETDTAFDNNNFIDWLCQQNKQLLDEIDELKSKVSNWMDKYTEVNEENKQLKASKSEEIEAVDALLNTFGQYCTLNGIKLTDSNKVGQAVIDFKKSDIYEIFKNQK